MNAASPAISVGDGLLIMDFASDESNKRVMEKNQSEVALNNMLSMLGGSQEFRTLAKNDSLEQFRYMNPRQGESMAKLAERSVGQTADGQTRDDT